MNPEILAQFTWWSALDIFLVALAIYYILLLVKGTRAAQVLTGLLLIAAVFLLSSIVPLTTVNWVMNKFSSSLLVILFILFQDDIRLALGRLGKKPFAPGQEITASKHMFDEIARAANILATTHTGALLVLERNIILSRYVDIGTLVDSKVSKELLLSIFHPTSPIHDGAVIIQKDRLTAAGCFLPILREEDLRPEWGTRFRAALGISFETDAVVVVVSEERGNMTLVYDKKVYPAKNKEELKKMLYKFLIDEPKYAQKELEQT